MDLPQRTFAAEAGSGALRVAVAVSLRKPLAASPMVVELTGTQYPGCKVLKEYYSDSHKLHTALSGEEYCDAVHAVIKRLCAAADAPSTRTKPGVLRLVHDKGPPHISYKFRTFCFANQVMAVVLPPR